MALLDVFKTNCRKATYLHEKSREGDISFGEKLGMRLHMLYCKLCRAFVKQIELIERSAKAARERDVKLDPATRGNMQRALNEQIKG